MNHRELDELKIGDIVQHKRLKNLYRVVGITRRTYSLQLLDLKLKCVNAVFPRSLKKGSLRARYNVAPNAVKVLYGY